MNVQEILRALKAKDISPEQARIELSKISKTGTPFFDETPSGGSGETNTNKKKIKELKETSMLQEDWHSGKASSLIDNSSSSKTISADAEDNCIAIIGMSGRFPDADTLDEYWENLAGGKNCIREVPSHRWSIDEYYDPDPVLPGKTYCKWIGMMKDVDKFDPLFFNISPAEAELMDPQHRLFLESCWKCIEDAGINPISLSGSRCGVFVGCGTGDYGQVDNKDGLSAHGLMGSSPSMLSARISYILNLKGPCLAIDTACSSSLVAIAEACNSLILKTSDIALAGGVYIMLGAPASILASKAGMLSKDGRCFTFDTRANGFVPGEGVGTVLLKRLSDAKRDGDPVYGIVRGWGINQDGKTNGITAPSVNSQIALEKEVYERFDIHPETITMVEAHGTGTKLGDPIEVEALTEAFQSFTQKRNYCALGSSKSNIGHLIKAAGIAGVIKVLLSMRNKLIPPTINFENLNEHIDVQNSPFFINTTLKPWQPPSGVPRRACISSFGFSGTNSHLVLEEYDSEPRNTGFAYSPDQSYLFSLSAKRKEQLITYAENIKKFIERQPKVNLADLAYTLQTGREPMEYRLAFVMDSRETLLKRLDEFIHNELSHEIFTDQVKKAKGKDAKRIDKDVKELVRIALENKELSKIGLAWVKGAEVNWNLLYKDSSPAKMHLPAYPFARDRYWLPEETELNRVKEVSLSNNNVLHPLVHRNSSELFKQKFSTAFDGQEFFFTDHRVNGQKILPGVAYLEMAYEAFRLSVSDLPQNRTVVKLKNVVWASPVIAGDAPMHVTIRLTPDGSDQVNYEICSEQKDAPGELSVHNFGVACHHSIDTLPSTNLSEWIEKSAKQIFSSEQCYEAFEKGGLNYGPAHKGIDAVYVGESHVLAKLRLPTCISETAHLYTLHPSIMDSAFQASVALTIDQSSSSVALPFALEGLEVWSPCAASMWALVQFSAGSSKGDKVQKRDIDLYDESGNLCVRIKGLSSRVFEDKLGPSPGTETLLFVPKWKEQQAVSSQKKDYARHIIIAVEENDALLQYLKKEMPATEFVILKEGSGSIAVRFESYAWQLIEIIRSQISNRSRENVLVQLILPVQEEGQVLSGLSGVLKVVGLEFPHITAQVIQVPLNETPATIKGELLENMFMDRDKDIFYKDQKRFVLNWEELYQNTLSEDIWKDNGCYLITGGGSGLGLIFAREIACRSKGAKVILTGRSLLGMEKEAAIEEVRLLGCQVEYYRTDIRNRQEVTALISEIQKKYGALNGIIHSAGVIRDSLIMKKDHEEFDEVMGAKVRGLVNIDETTQNMPLDFFVHFSSGAGVRGNPGQSDYAAANAFMDIYSQYRNDLVKEGKRKGKTVSINWPLWKEGGMKVHAEREKVMHSKGLVSLSTSSGIKAFYRSIASGYDQVMVMEGYPQKIRQTFHAMLPSVNYQVVQPSTAMADAALNNTVLQNKIQTMLVQAVSKHLKIRVQDIDNQTELSEYGFDSISFTRFINSLNQEYKLDLTPTVFFEYPSIYAFSEYLTKEFRAVFESKWELSAPSNPSEQVAKKDSGGLQEKVETAMMQAVSKHLKIRLQDIDLHAELSEYGFDSISFTRFINGLNQEFKLDLTPTIFFEYSTIQSFSGYLVKEYASIFEAKFGVRDAHSEADPLPVIEHKKENSAKNSVVESIQSRSSVTSGPNKDKSSQEPIAIVGISGIFPLAKDIEAYWKNLVEGKDCIEEIPADRWDWRILYGDPAKEPNKTNIKWGGFIDGVAEFDPLFFGISPKEAELMDPQQRLLMLYVWKAMEDAGYSAQSISGTRTAIYAGTGASGYAGLIARANIPIEGYSATGNSPSVGPNRMNYFLNIHGPSEPIQTACSSSLVAIHRAVVSIEAGICDMAIAGGINTILTPEAHISFNKAGMLCEDGRCKTFSDQANGYVRGEGVGMLFLKKLSAAEAEGDHIYGVIKGTSENHGGRASSLTAPNPKAQAEVLKTAYLKAGIDPRTVTYIEAHGTGTELGDPIEINGMKSAFKELYEKTGDPDVRHAYCGLGSVKTNIGHLELSAGVAGVIKVLLQMQHRTLVKSLHIDRMNPYIQLKDSPFYIVQENRPWERLKDDRGIDIPLRSGVSSFGFGGVNAHVVIEEYIDHRVKEEANAGPYMIVFSARNEESLLSYASILHGWLEGRKDVDLNEVAYTLQVGRDAMEERLGMLVRNVEELKEKLLKFVAGQEDAEDVYRGQVKKNKEALSLLTQDEDMSYLVMQWLDKGKYGKVLELWSKGMSVEWSKLYGSKHPKRISLPSYSFSKERYWVTASSGRQTVLSQPTGGSQLHPLVHTNCSDLTGQRYKSSFSGEEPFLKDHVVRGSRILPGVAYLEMARFAIVSSLGMLNEPGSSVRLKHVMWSRPLISGASGVDVVIEIEAEEDGDLSFRISSGVGEKLLEHSQGRAELVESAEAETVNLEELRSRCVKGELSREACYEMFTSLGFFYGPSHQGVEQVYIGEGEVLAKLKLKSAGEEYILHHGILDAALQAVIGLNTDSAGKKVSLPFALEALEIFAPCNVSMWAHLRPVVGASSTDNLRKLDIDLYDYDGKLCVRLLGFSSRILEGNIEFADSDTKLFVPVWRNSAISEDLEERKTYDRHLVVLFREDKELQKFLSEKTSWEVLMLHTNKEKLGTRYEKVSLELFEALKNLMKMLGKDKVLVQVLTDTEESSEIYSGLAALLKTSFQENPRIFGQVIMIDRGDSAERKASRLKENADSAFVKIMYKDDQRYVEHLDEVLPGVDAPVNEVWKDYGVYLVTGGVGGLGLLFCEEIVKSVQSPILILTGRSELNEEKHQQLEAFQQKGARVKYYRMDVSNREEVETLVSELRKEYGRLNGVIHAAGVLRDNFIIRKTSEEFREVLQSKVQGLIYLDEALRAEPLDHFIMFSSISGSLGNAGQSDYAAANSFMDGYALYRSKLTEQGNRYGRTLSLNWPLWEEGGMRVNEELAKQMRSRGVIPLSRKSGLEAFYRSMGTGHANVIVMSGEASAIAKRLQGLDVVAPLPTTAVKIKESKVHTSSLVTEGQLEEKTVMYFRKILSAVLKLPAQSIDENTAFEKYGIDSLLVMQLTNELEKDYGALPKTLFFEYQDLRSLARYFTESYPERLMELTGISPKQEAVRTVPVIIAEKESIANKVLSGIARRNLASSNFVKGDFKDAKNTAISQDIAIIGVSGRYPMAKNIDEFWKNLSEGRDCITEIPEARWDNSLFYDKAKGRLGKTYCNWGGFLDDVDMFDPMFFNISPLEASIMDPQQRLFLEIVWELLEHSGYTREHMQQKYSSKVGVFIGAMYQHYPLFDSDLVKESLLSVSSYSAIANKISYHFNFQGPSVAIDTMCSSSLVAIHMACDSLLKGESKVAIAGGVNLSIHPKKYLGLSMNQMLGSNADSRSFAEGDGYLPSEGVGAVILKPLSEAIKDKDTILAVIKSTHINHGGKTNGYSVPNLHAQSQLIEENFKKAGIDPRTISYVEAAANGSSLGDPIELAALTRVFEKYTSEKQFCAIGSVKSNIGHAEAASGISQLTKVILQLQHKKLFPSIMADTLNPNLSFNNTPFYFQGELSDWHRPEIKTNGREKVFPLRASISSFGAGGSNAHLILEEYSTADIDITEEGNTDPVIIVLSAKTAGALKAQAKQILAHVADQNEINLTDLAYTLQVGREAMEQRLSLVADTKVALVEGLKQFLEEDQKPETIISVFTGNLQSNSAGIVSLLTGKTGEILIETLLKERDWNKLALYWTQGGTIKWDRLYDGRRVRRIVLPVYPFERRRCWVDHTEVQAVPAREASKVEVTSMDDPLTLSTRLKVIIASLLGLMPEEIIVERPLRDYGFDSILSIRLFQQLQAQFDPSLDLSKLQQCHTTQDILNLLSLKEQTQTIPEDRDPNPYQPGRWKQFPELVRLNAIETGRPVFWIHAGLGGVEMYQGIAQKANRPFYGIQAKGWMTDHKPLRGLKAMAAYYAHIILSVQSEGPYDLGGYSLGGDLAYEVTRQLQELGHTVETIVMLDSLDSSHLRKINLSSKTEILQAINTALIAAFQHEPENLGQVLINRDSVDLTLDDASFIKELITMAQARGLSKTEAQLRNMVHQSAKVLHAFESNKFYVQPLADKETVTCYYFRNKSGLFLGILEPFFVAAPEEYIQVDHARYWEEWENAISNIHIMDLDSSTHMTLLFEPAVNEVILEFCENIYSVKGISEGDLESFKRRIGAFATEKN